MLTANRLNGNHEEKSVAKAPSRAEAICRKFGWTSPVQVPGSLGMMVTWAAIQPEHCEYILEHMHILNNRRIKSKQVPRLATAMLRKKWRKTHQGMAFGSDGLLFDGHHRCRACIASGQPFETLVFFGLDTYESIHGVDAGSARTCLDISGLLGLPLNSRRSATIKWIVFGGKWKTAMAAEQEAELCEHFSASMSFCEEHMKGMKPGIQKAPVWGAVCRAYYHEPTQRLKEFCNVLLTGCIDPRNMENDISAQRLNQKLLTTELAGGTGLKQAFLMTVNHCKAFCNYVEKRRRTDDDVDSVYPLTDRQNEAIREILGLKNA